MHREMFDNHDSHVDIINLHLHLLTVQEKGFLRQSGVTSYAIIYYYQLFAV